MSNNYKIHLFERAREQLKLTHQIAEGMKEAPTESLGHAANLVKQCSKCAVAALAFEAAMRGAAPPAQG